MSIWTFEGIQLHTGDSSQVLQTLESGSVDCCVTSPPYWGLRDYGCEGQVGLESSPEEYVEKMVGLFREVRRVLRDDGTLWLNLGDTYTSGGRNEWRSGVSDNKGQQVLDNAAHRPETPAGLKPKDLVGIPWRVAFALQADGWYLRQDIIWHKPNPMPESVRDRCTKAHEYVFLLSKGPRYYFDSEAIQEPQADTEHTRSRYKYKPGGNRRDGDAMDNRSGSDFYEHFGNGHRNKRSVWTVTTKPYPDAHFATFPPDLIKPCILAGSREGGVVLDPFMGSGTTAAVARELGRRSVGVELNSEYVELAKKRIGPQRSLFPADSH